MWQIYRLELRVPVNVVQVALIADSTDCLQQSFIRIRPVLSLSFSYSSNLQCSYAQESLQSSKKVQESNTKTENKKASLLHIKFFYSCDNFLLPVLVGTVSGLKMILIYPENWFPMNKLADLSREAQ